MGSRQLFLRARKWCHSPHHKHTPWQVYAAAAALEWQVGGEVGGGGKEWGMSISGLTNV